MPTPPENTKIPIPESFNRTGTEKETKETSLFSQPEAQRNATLFSLCLMEAAKTYSIPPAVLVGMYKHEDGKVGGVEEGGDGKKVLGPMKVLESQVPEFSRIWGVNTDTAYKIIRDDACTNINISAWNFRSHLNETGSLEKALVKYGESRKSIGEKYKSEVLEIMRKNRLIKE